MKLAIMQPYFFPYIGYYQLVMSVDRFIFFDDVNFINKGWINRNNLLVNKQKHLFTLPLQNASQNSKINSIALDPNAAWKNKFFKTVEMAYKKAPHFAATMGILEKSLSHTHIHEAAATSVTEVFSYIHVTRDFLFSSALPDTVEPKGQDRILEICKQQQAHEYINLPGGRELYNSQVFDDKGIKLTFINPAIAPYPQWDSTFTGGLSMIDVLMFNSPNEIRTLLGAYTL